MKRVYFGLLAGGLAALLFGCTAEPPSASVATVDEPAATVDGTSTPNGEEVKLVKLSVPNMT